MMDIRGQSFNSKPLHCHVMTLAKLFTQSASVTTQYNLCWLKSADALWLGRWAWFKV